MPKVTRLVIVRIACCLLLAVSYVSPVTAQYVVGASNAASDTSSVSVSATAEEHLTPTHAVVSFQIRTTGDSPDAAAMTNGEARAATIAALEPLGFAPEQIAMWGYGAGPGSTGGYGPPPAGMSSSFEARSGLRVVVRPLERLDAVVASALLAGASSSNVTLESDDLEAALRLASERAVARARLQAEAMAAAAGGELGDLLSLLTTPDYGTMSMEQSFRYSGPPGSQGVQIFPWDGILRVTVQATWVFVR